MNRPHLTQRGRFRSDKYKAWCKPNFLALKFTDVTAQPFIYAYAALRGIVDREFQEDVFTALENVGYKPTRLFRWAVAGLLFGRDATKFLLRR